MTSTNENKHHVPDYSKLSKEQFDKEIQRGFDNFKHGNPYPQEEIIEELKRRSEHWL